MTALLEALEDDRDRALVARFQSGDHAAFGDLYAAHYTTLLRFCMRKVRDPHLAEEIAQDAFLRAYQALNRLSGERRFYPWLTVIARRLVIDHVRRHGRVEPVADVDAGTAMSAADVVVGRHERDQVLAALDRVRERHREILRLRDFEGLSYDEIADRLGVSVTAIAPLLHRARAALRREFAAVAEGRVAALLHLPLLLAAVRRLRERANAWALSMPDGSVLAGPAAGAIIAVGTLLGLAEPGPALAGRQSVASVPAIGSHAADGVRPAGEEPEPRPAASAGRIAPEAHAGPIAAKGGPAFGVNDPEGAHTARERARREPVHLEVGPFFFGTDPEGIPDDAKKTADRALMD